ncbi:hypothetical protein [Pseudomonas sp. IT-P218]|uniref:hypothetical protein n=1 Tax=Pseudomonas sp. IT-P218 TaxID=3026449 RepID=UPI0039DF9DC3
MTQQVLKTVTAQHIQAAKDEAKHLYMQRVEGHGVDFQGQADESGNLPRRWMRGAIVEFVASHGVDELLDLVLAKMGEGWTRSSTPTYCVSSTFFNVWLMKPVDQQEEDLKALYAEAEAKLRARVAHENEEIVEREVQLQLANAARKKAEQEAKEAEETAATIRKEVEAALGVTRAAVRASLKGSK